MGLVAGSASAVGGAFVGQKLCQARVGRGITRSCDAQPDMRAYDGDLAGWPASPSAGRQHALTELPHLGLAA
jgi:hypothetical protein